MNTILLPGSSRQATRPAAFSIRLAAACAILLLARTCPAQTQTPNVITLTFEGLKDGEYVNNYYNGGYGLLPDPTTGSPGANGSGPGPNYGITFGLDSLALVSSTAGRSGNFTGNPSGSTVVFFLTGTGVVMNVANGFQNGFSFYYSAELAGTVQVYDGLNATGNLLATISLPANVNSDNCPATAASGLPYCYWQQSNNSFSGTAKSVNFGGSADYIGFDNITIGSAVATSPLVVTTPSATATSLPTGTVGAQYNFQPAASGGTTPYTWTATGLPAGLTVTNGAITGTPTTAGTFTVTLKVTDSTSPPLSATSQSLTLTVNPVPPPPLTVSCNPQSGTYTAGTAYSTLCTASGGTSPYTWSFSNLPSWLTPSATSGTTITLSGTLPAAPPSLYVVTVTLTDSTTPTKQTVSTPLDINVVTALQVSCTPLMSRGVETVCLVGVVLSVSVTVTT